MARSTLNKYLALISSIGRMRHLRTNAPYAVLELCLVASTGIVRVWALANYLPREQFGYWGYAAAIAAIAALFTLPGSSQAVSYGAARSFDGVLLDTFFMRLRYGALMTISVLIVAALHFHMGQGTVAALLLISAVFVPVEQASESAAAYLTGRGEFRNLFLRRATLDILSTSCVLITAVYTHDVIASSLALQGTTAATSLLLFALVYRGRRNSSRLPDAGSMHAKFAALAMVSTVSSSIERPILAAATGFHSLAAYNLAKSSMLPVSLGRVIEKLLLSQLASRSSASTGSSVWHGALLLFFAGWLAYAALTMLIGLAVRWALPHYEDALPLINTLLLVLPLNWPAKTLQSWLYADPTNHRAYWIVSWTQALTRAAFVPLGAWLYGAQGAAVSWVLAEVSFLIATLAAFEHRRRLIASEAKC